MTLSIQSTTAELLQDLLATRILILDGAMGTMIQRYKLQEADFRGKQFAGHPREFALQGFNAVSVGTVVGSFLSTLLLFSVPVTLLGMASPFALRLALTDIERAGRTSGRLSSLATVGAIIGTFGSALVLIPGVGTQRTLLSAALLVALPALLLTAAVNFALLSAVVSAGVV